MPHGSHGLFTQSGFNDPSQEDSSHFGVAGPGPLQSQVISISIPLFHCPIAYASKNRL